MFSICSFSMFPMFSIFSQLTPCSTIRDGRMGQFVEPCCHHYRYFLIIIFTTILKGWQPRADVANEEQSKPGSHRRWWSRKQVRWRLQWWLQWWWCWCWVDPNPDLSDAGEAENRWDGDFHGDDGHHDDDSDGDDDDVECWNLWKSSACQRLYMLQGGRGGTRQS